MANFVFTAFDGLTLPTYDVAHDSGTDRSVEGNVALPGQPPFDALGTERARGMPRIVQAHCRVITGSYVDLQTALDNLRAKRGVRGTLTMTLAEGTTRTRTARLRQIVLQRRGGHPLDQPVDLVFQLYGEVWNGALSENAYTLDSNPKACTIPLAGNDIARNITITVTADTSDITAITITNANTGHKSSITYGGTISAGTSLVIDCGAMSVKNNGVNDYDNLTAEATHEISEWLRFPPGATFDVSVSRTGGSNASTIDFDFYDAWA